MGMRFCDFLLGAAGWGWSGLEAFGGLVAAGEDLGIAVEEVGFGLFGREELAMVL